MKKYPTQMSNANEYLTADPALPHTDFLKKEIECTWSLLAYLILLIL